MCYGSAEGVRLGDYKTDAECEALLRQEVGEFWGRMDPCVADTVPISVQASILELGYNVGTAAACRSTMVRKANAGDYAGACAELDRWVNAGGRRIRGLVNRRNASQVMCVRDL
ncbi:lysozyme [Paracoccus beibuensis]|uniref:lysozyme n=1 Tax=Paracoccus beibuensis TaxID=547602 RepID=UPI003898D92F